MLKLMLKVWTTVAVTAHVDCGRRCSGIDSGRSRRVARAYNRYGKSLTIAIRRRWKSLSYTARTLVNVMSLGFIISMFIQWLESSHDMKKQVSKQGSLTQMIGKLRYFEYKLTDVTAYQNTIVIQRTNSIKRKIFNKQFNQQPKWLSSL